MKIANTYHMQHIILNSMPINIFNPLYSLLDLYFYHLHLTCEATKQNEITKTLWMTATRIQIQLTRPQRSSLFLSLCLLSIFLSKRILVSRNCKSMAMKLVGNFVAPELSATALNYLLFLVYW